jgi:hypothetical protein
MLKTGLSDVQVQFLREGLWCDIIKFEQQRVFEISNSPVISNGEAKNNSESKYYGNNLLENIIF